MSPASLGVLGALLLVATGCTAPPAAGGGAGTVSPAKLVCVVSHGWRVGLAVEQAAIPLLGAGKTDYRGARALVEGRLGPRGAAA